MIATHGMAAIPEAWQTGMTASQRISALLDQL